MDDGQDERRDLLPSREIIDVEKGVNVTARDYEEANAKLEQVRQGIHTKLVNLARDLKYWKREVDLPWTEPGKVKKGTVFLSRDAIDFNWWVFNAVGEDGSGRIYAVENPGDGLKVAEFSAIGQDGGLLGYKGLTVFEFRSGKIEADDSYDDQIGVGTSAGRDFYSESDSLRFNGMSNALGWVVNCVFDEDDNIKSKSVDFLYQKGDGFGGDLLLHAERLEQQLRDAAVVGKIDLFDMRELKVEVPDRKLLGDLQVGNHS